MVEKLLVLEKISVQQCQTIAKKIGFDSTTFDLCGPNGKKQCKWLDAYFGFFEEIGKEKSGFMTVGQIEFTDLWCENVRCGEKKACSG